VIFSVTPISWMVILGWNS